MRRWTLALLLFCLCVGVTGCSKEQKELPPTRATITLIASEDVNPDIEGRPSPIVIRLFYLKTTDVFSTVDFFALFDQGDETLADALVAKEEYQLGPGERRQFALGEIDEDIRYIGVIGAYRNIDKARWRASIEVSLNHDNQLIADVRRSDIRIGQY